jgi:hypothetical protein
MRGMVVPSRAQGQCPRDAMLHPVWEPTTSGEPTSDEWLARCLLGQGWIGGTGKLTMLDLRVWAALCAMLREQLNGEPPSDDLTLDRGTSRTVQATGYELADRVLGSEGGRQWRSLRRSLARLRATTITVRIVERDQTLAIETLHEGLVGLVGEIWTATTRLDLTEPRQWGALKGTASLQVELGRWPAQQVLADRCTWLDLDLLRALGQGLPARLWVALEGWARWPARSFDGREETAIGLGEPARESLGVARYSQPRQARAALNRAGQQLIAVDPAYEYVACERRGGGWCLVVRRLQGSRSRTTAREGASWRSAGIAAGKRSRSERAAVRSAARASLPQRQPDPAA